MGWHALRNGALLRAVAQDRFDVLLTVDRNLKREQNLATLPVAVVVLLARSNRLADLLPLVCPTSSVRWLGSRHARSSRSREPHLPSP